MDLTRKHSSMKRRKHDPIKIGCSRCREYSNSLKNLLQSSSESFSESLSGCKEDLQFVRAIVWLKHVIASMKEISLNDLQAAFSHCPNSSESFNESSDIRTFHVPVNDYESNLSQSSDNTIDLLFPHRKLKKNDTNQRNLQRSLENGNNHLYEFHSSNSNMFNESAQSSAFNSIPELQSDNTEYSAAGSSNHLIRGNTMQNFSKKKTCSFNKVSSTINKTIANNSTVLFTDVKHDSGYSTMDLIPRSSKFKIATETNICSFPKYRKIDSELSQSTLLERSSPERWSNDYSNTKEHEFYTRIIPDSEDEFSCTSTQSSASCFTSEFKCDKISSAQTNGTACTEQISTCSFRYLKSFLNPPTQSTLASRTIWSSELSSNCSTFATGRNNPSEDNVSAISGNYEIRDNCQTFVNLITPETRRTHSEGSSEPNIDQNSIKITRSRSDDTSTFRKSIICRLSNVSNNSKEQEEQQTSATRSTFRTEAFGVSDVTLFTPIQTGRGKTKEEADKLSYTYLNYVLDSLNVDKVVSKFVGVILYCFEDRRITKAYMKRRRWENTLEKEAIRTVLSFCYTFEAETNTSTCTRAIVLLVRRSLNHVIEENTKSHNVLESIHHVSVILEFLSSKDVCIKTIDYLICTLEACVTTLVSCAFTEQLSIHVSSCKVQVLMYALKICLKKYRQVRANIEEYPEEIISIADSLRKQKRSKSKDIDKEDSIEERERPWIDVLEKLPVILIDDFFYLAVEARGLKNILILK